MKKSTKLISMLLAVMMIAALLPAAALADDVASEGLDAGAIIEGIAGSITGGTDGSDIIGSITGGSTGDIIGSITGGTEGGDIIGSITGGSTGDGLGGVIDSINGIQIPTYMVYCSLAGKLPASGAVITLTNNLNGEANAYTANMVGLALIPKSLVGVYTVSATCDGPITGLTYKAPAGLTWTINSKLDVDKIVLYPVLNVGLNYTDHFAYMIGYPNGNVQPTGNITRAEVATIIYRLMTDDSRAKFESTTSGLSDVKAGDWYNEEVCTLVKAGVITGYPDGSFKPNQNVTRAEFSAMIGKLFSVEYVGSDIFGDTNSSWAESYINLLAKLGIIKGDNVGNANPDDLLTRAEAAAMCNRLLGRICTTDSVNSVTGVKDWPDNASSQWYYYDMLEATNSHDYTWTFDAKNVVTGEFSITEQWTEIRTDAPVWG